MSSLGRAIEDDIKIIMFLFILMIFTITSTYIISEMQKIFPSPLYSTTINTLNTTTMLIITIIASLPPATILAIIKILEKL